MDIANNRGSEWRKWDLHLHSPLSFLKNEYGSNWEGWIENLKERNIKAIGLTNYFRFNVVDSNNEINIVREKLKDIEIVVFPNLEFRLAQPNKDGDFINIHVIFSDKVKTLDIENFLNRLKTKNDKYCSDLKSKSDFEGATINDETLIKQLESDFVRLQDYLIVCCPNGYGGFRQNNREGRSVEVASQYDNLADIFFARQQDTSYFLDEKRFQGANQKAVIYCSDAHSINDMAIDKFTWIKSDVNFEGLKQVMHEPEQRVAIQTIKPEEKAGYQVIDSIKIIHSDFLPQTLYFNENLNSIIGGRSTGKSILLGIIAKRLNSNHEVKYDNEEYTKYVDEIVSDIQIKWKDGLIDNNRDIEYFPQSYMYSLAKNQKKELDNLVENIIKQDNNKERLINTYKTFSSENNTEITNKINKLFQLIKDINSKRILLKEKGDQKGIETEIDRLTKELLELKSKSHISHEELTQYNAFKSENDSLNKQFQNISDEIFKIEALKSKFFITNEIDFELVALSDSNKELIKSGFTNLKLEFENKWIVKIDSFIELNRKQKEHVETSITAIIENPIYIKGFEEFQNNTHYKGVEEKLKIQKDKLEDIIKIDKEIKDLHEQIDYFKISIKEANRNYINKIEAIKNDLSISNGKLEIKAYPKLNKNKFKDLLNWSINQQSHQGQNIVNIDIDTTEKFFTEINNLFDKLLNNSITLKGNYNNLNLSQELMSKNFFNISYDIIYEDPFSKMSEGKKAFVILLLLLDFSNKDCPILIDQPEDDLDNRAIYKDLVKYIKIKKKQRQIIVVTHNANIVVSSDSELVVISNQNGIDSPNKNKSKFQYVSGSIENTKKKNELFNILLESQGIKEHICEILEGGNDAFKLREKKYSIK